MSKKLKKLLRSIPEFFSSFKEKKELLLILLILSIIFDILAPYRNIDVIIFTILIFYVVFIKLFRIRSKFTLTLCLFLLSLMILEFFLTQASFSTEKTAVWLIFFLGIGVVQKWNE